MFEEGCGKFPQRKAATVQPADPSAQGRNNQQKLPPVVEPERAGITSIRGYQYPHILSGNQHSDPQQKHVQAEPGPATADLGRRHDFKPEKAGNQQLPDCQPTGKNINLSAKATRGDSVFQHPVPAGKPESPTRFVGGLKRTDRGSTVGSGKRGRAGFGCRCFNS